MTTYVFSENNSGGVWWLNRSQYDRMLQNGWYLNRAEDEDDGVMGNFLGSGDVPWGWRHGLAVEANSLDEAIVNFEVATGADYSAEGCDCCGRPFSIYEEF